LRSGNKKSCVTQEVSAGLGMMFIDRRYAIYECCIVHLCRIAILIDICPLTVLKTGRAHMIPACCMRALILRTKHYQKADFTSEPLRQNARVEGAARDRRA